MNANIQIADQREINGEPRGTVIVQSSELASVELGGSIIPNIIDEIPIISVLASCADGISTIKDAGELRKKESDRIKAIKSGLDKIGIKATEEEDGLTIVGKSLKEVEPMPIDSFHDHRIAMSFLISSTGIGKHVKVLGTENITTSFPQFIELAGKIGIDINEA